MMMRAALLLAGATASLALITRPPADNHRPIIGILTEPFKGQCDTLAPFKVEGTPESRQDHRKDRTGGQPTGCFAAYYTEWAQSGGARVVPVRWDASDAELRETFDSINGFLVTGGGLDLQFNNTYVKAANKILHWAADANKKGDYFPVWGTCMGFQLLCILAAQNTSVLLTHAFDSERISLPLNWTMDPKKSQMFNECPEDVIETLSTPVTTNLHHDGVPPSMWGPGGNSNLTAFFDLVSTSTGRKGKVFGSTIAGKHGMPFYGTQWHPERPQYEWKESFHMVHTWKSVVAMQYTANFFINEARRNKHAYKNASVEANSLIYNWNPVYYGNSYSAYLI